MSACGTCESMSAAYGTYTLETMFSLKDFISPACGSLQTRCELISFSEALGHGRSLHIQLDRRTGGKHNAVTHIEDL